MKDNTNNEGQRPWAFTIMEANGLRPWSLISIIKAEGPRPVAFMIVKADGLWPSLYSRPKAFGL